MAQQDRQTDQADDPQLRPCLSSKVLVKYNRIKEDLAGTKVSRLQLSMGSFRLVTFEMSQIMELLQPQDTAI
jgi:hypothetical protein